MGFDIRLPVGFLFTLIGLLLLGQGFVTGASTAPGSAGLPVNAAWGGVVLGFGLVCWWLAKRQRR